MDEIPCTARCQSCNLLTSRKCSACNVCSYCSAECEASATTECSADVACKLHLAWPHEATNLGPSGAHFLMLPCMQTPLAADAAPHLRWTALHQATVHYLHVMLARSPSRVHSKTAFGLSVALTPELRYSCGCQRLVFPLGRASHAASMMVGNMATLAHAQLGEERASAPQLRDVHVPDKRQAVILSGLVTKAQGGLAHEDPQWVVHFDSIYLTHANNTWTVKRVQPLWEQNLTKLDDNHYRMGFKPEGRVPPNARCERFTRTVHFRALLQLLCRVWRRGRHGLGRGPSMRQTFCGVTLTSLLPRCFLALTEEQRVADPRARFAHFTATPPHSPSFAES